MLQDNVIIQRGIFHYIYHIGCAFNLHSIINNGLVPGGQNLSRRQTVIFLPTDPRDESHKDPEHIDFSVPRRARYLHSAWKRHQDAVFWVDIDLAIREGLTFYQTQSNAIILQRTLPAHYVSKSWKIENWRSLVWTIFVSPTTTKELLETRSQLDQREWSIGFYSQQPVGKLAQQSFGEVQHAKFSKQIQPKPKPICDRSGKPEDTERVFMEKSKKRLVHKRSMINVYTKNLALQIEQGNLWNQAQAHTHSERTICSCRTSWHCII